MKYIGKHFLDDELEDKLTCRVREFIQDLEKKGIIVINEPFSWKVECHQKDGFISIKHDEVRTAVDNMLDEIKVTTQICDEKTIKRRKK